MSKPDTPTPEPTGQPVPITMVTATAPGDAVTARPARPATVTPIDQPRGPTRRWWLWIVGGVVLLLALIAGTVWFVLSLNTVSTDDAYVSGYPTFVAPRVAGQVEHVLVKDNNRVKKGDVLVQLDKVPFQVQVDIAQAAVTAAQSDLVAAKAQARATEGQMRSLRFNLERSIEDVHNQIALLRLKVATLQSQKASVDRAQADYDRAKPLVASGALSKEEFDQRKEALLVAQAKHEEALQAVFQVRVALGLPPKPEKGDDLAKAPDDLDQTFSSVKQAQSSLIQAAAHIGVTDSFNKSPKQMVEDFYKRDPKGQGDIDRIYEELLKDSPGIKQAEAKLAQAQRNLDQAKLNLHYCDIVSEIDGVVTSRNVNPGNNVSVGQNLMAVRSLKEIWIDANFKETQLADLRIGQQVRLEVDMYGSRREYQGRITGFTMGTGQTLALLPPQNATGNFVKIVQRLPVRIELINYDPDDPDTDPLFIGLSVVASVYIRRPLVEDDPGKGSFLQPREPRPQGLPFPRP